jgi:hypothetical protein
MMPSCSLRVVMVIALGFLNVDSEWTLGAQQLSMCVEKRESRFGMEVQPCADSSRSLCYRRETDAQ